VEKETHLLELCRYVVLNPVRANLVRHPRQWRWSSYRATVGEAEVPRGLTVDWILEQFGRRRAAAQGRYRDFMTAGRDGPPPWEQVRGQIYLGSEAFITRHQPDELIREVPRRQTQAHRPTLRVLFATAQHREQAIHLAYRQYGYRLAEIAEYLDVHYATVSRWLRQAEQINV